MVLWTFGCKIHGSTQFSSMAIYFCKRLNNFFDFKSLSFFEEGKDFYKNYLKIGISGIIGGTGLGIAMITFIYSITNTSAAVTLLCLAAMPFFTALLGFLFLKEKISLNVWIAIFIATVGIIIIAIGNTEKNSFFKKKNFTRFIKARLTTTHNGNLEIKILKGQESFRIKSFVESNIWGLFKHGQSNFKKNELIDCYSPIGSNINIFK